MRRAAGITRIYTATLALGAVAATFASAFPASAAGAAGVGAASQVAGAASVLKAPETVCVIEDERIDELSGLVSTPDGYVVVNDGSDDPGHRRIFFLGEDCSVKRAVRFPDKPTDTEDLAIAADGTLWIGDIGSNDGGRKTIGLWKLAKGADEPVYYKLKYPEKTHNAETLVLNGDGTPIIVTKDPFVGELYVPDGELKAGKTTALRAAGEFRIPFTSTGNPHGIAGRFVLTGGAVSADGAKVALRTYSDAFEFAVPDGDVIAALTKQEPKVVALPDEPQGEAISYSQDGRSLLTASEGKKPDLLRYRSALPDAPPATPRAAQPSASASQTGTAEPQVAAASAGINRAITIGAAALALILLAIAFALRRRQD